MHTDPIAYIIGAALLGGMIGFFGCCLYASDKIRRANLEGYKEGLDAANRKLIDHITRD
jgi:hypothetical protein